MPVPAFPPLPPGFLDRLSSILGPRNLLTGGDATAPFLTDERRLFPGAAAAVACPGSTAEVSALVRACREAGVPIVPQGGNTGLVGGASAPAGSLLVNLRRMNRIRGVDPANATLTAEAGTVLATVQEAARDAGRLFPLSLASEGSAQIGGLLATNAGGINVLRHGNMRDLTLGIEAVMPDGRVLHGLGGLRKDNTGYDLRHLLIGSEGTLAILTAAVLRLSPLPRQRVTALVAVSGAAQALALLDLLRDRAGEALVAFEFMVQATVAMLVEAGHGFPVDPALPAFVLFDLTSADPEAPLAAQAEAILARAFDGGIVLDGTIGASEGQNRAMWDLRERLPEVQKHFGPSIKHDIAVAVSRIPDFLSRAGAACAAAMPGCRIVPFGHLGDGNLHYNLSPPDGMAPADFLARQGDINRIVHDIVHDLGGSISAEHGVGLMKRAELARYKDPVALDAMRAIKAALDPANLMNPGKLLP
ncbi:FAD-binding oxidoreductase [Ruixingdingia sedimenti]|uniref:FAD-binding oxidoreductase n=1 Tax=Ruixingdingia sedimenti TaxID=3073604 RepID=A0ABU1F9C4_9RHOB|nr:FAD-binding oxidoreductase [Xinfangfangia sp. LG-4]MDR5653490.1 FAD-binding oxidoreductase [Xinfangfangia sp. LG-4]